MSEDPEDPSGRRGSVERAIGTLVGDKHAEADGAVDVAPARRLRQGDGTRREMPDCAAVTGVERGTVDGGQLDVARTNVNQSQEQVTKGDPNSAVAATAVVRLNQTDGCPEVVQALLGAFAIGDAFIGIYDEADCLRYGNDAFLRAFDVKAGEVATFSSIVLQAHRHGKGVRIDASDPRSFIIEAQMR